MATIQARYAAAEHQLERRAIGVEFERAVRELDRNAGTADNLGEEPEGIFALPPVPLRIAGHPPLRARLARDESRRCLPNDWRVVAEREAVSYAWPKEVDDYDRYRIFAGTTTGGTIHVALGETHSQRWGRERRRAVAFLTSGTPQQPLSEFVAADDYDSTRELLSVIRGRGGTGQMYGPGDTLPEAYQEQFETALYSERIRYTGVWNKQVVVVHEDDFATILNHALIQGRRRDAARAVSRGSTIKGVTSSEFDGVTVPTLRSWERYWMDPKRHMNDPAISPERPVEKHIELIQAELRARGK